MPKTFDPEIIPTPPPAKGAKPFRWSPKTIAFCMAVGFFVLFWLAGQLSTLRWQLHHVH